MIEQMTYLGLLLLQPASSPTASKALQFSIITGVFVIVIVVVGVFIFKALRPKTDSATHEALKQDFEKSKESLLIAAQAKKAARESGESAERQQDAEEQERELLLQSIDVKQVVGKICPLSGLEMMDDQELVINPYTGQGYHFSAFLNDWVPGKERPKYVYRHPQGTVVKSNDLVRNY